MKLQDIVTDVLIPSDKLTKYALNINHPLGGDKAYMFERYLGYNQDNYSFLKQQILKQVLVANAIECQPNNYGRIFQIDMEILGNYEGQKEKVRTGWIIKFNTTVAQLTTLYIIGRK